MPKKCLRYAQAMQIYWRRSNGDNSMGLNEEVRLFNACGGVGILGPVCVLTFSF